MSIGFSGVTPAVPTPAGIDSPAKRGGMPSGAMTEPAPALPDATTMPSGSMPSPNYPSEARSAVLMPEGGQGGTKPPVTENVSSPMGMSTGSSDMPRGEMNFRPQPTKLEGAGTDIDTQSFEIPGDWRLILRRKS